MSDAKKELTDEQRDELGLQLIEAARLGDLKKAKELISVGANLDRQNQFGSTALILAVREGNIEITKELISAGAKLDIQNQYRSTALIWAAWNGKEKICKCLLAAGADVALTDNNSKNCVENALNNGQTDLAEYLRGIIDGTIPRPTLEEMGLEIKPQQTTAAEALAAVQQEHIEALIEEAQNGFGI